MAVLTAVLPVVLMLLVGGICNKYQIIDRNGIVGIKKLITNLLLPFVLFNALGTATYTVTTAWIILVMFLSILLSLMMGYLLKPLLPETVRSHVPFLVSGFEGGMMGYPLYIALMGIQQLHNIATIDIANAMYAFTVYLGLMMASEKGSSSARDLLQAALHAPAMYGVVFGILFGVTGLLRLLLQSPWGSLYTATISMLITPVSALILISVGYTLEFDREVVGAALKTAGLRLAVQSVLLAIVWLILRDFLTDPAMLAALLLYAFLPPQFISAIYTTNEAKMKYASTMTSLYMVVPISALILLAVYR